MATYPALDVDDKNALIVGDFVIYNKTRYKVLSIKMRMGTIGILDLGNGISVYSYDVTKETE